MDFRSIESRVSWLLVAEEIRQNGIEHVAKCLSKLNAVYFSVLELARLLIYTRMSVKCSCVQ